MDARQAGTPPSPAAPDAGRPRWGQRLRANRRRFAAVFLALLLGAWWLAFPGPDPTLWPPGTRDDRNVVYVCVNGFHSALTFPDYEWGFYQEWHLGATDWYLREDFPLVQRVWALFRPVPATVRFGLFPKAYHERMALPPASVFKFWLSEAGRRKLVAYLHRQRGGKVEQKGGFTFFATTRTWSPLWNCNGYIAGALQAAGLPIREALALEGITMGWQLVRCRRFQEDWLAREPPAAAGESEADFEGDHRRRREHRGRPG